jgi:hypothetical protein
MEILNILYEEKDKVFTIFEITEKIKDKISENEIDTILKYLYSYGLILIENVKIEGY